ncbi:vWA domain-containing protein [Flavihumibacter profundi]|uniref:vWA domain-containing protein n=1 Tax=Flavihumibacter profundi TaxID=2716883 RepID=UPI001CC81FBA|nr:VWA domain-containing protein [Flavihumibacter profundi]MBZ5857022.1 von Willebrand factor type A domain-containing protein [Flavihumibacter profundi]
MRTIKRSMGIICMLLLAVMLSAALRPVQTTVKGIVKDAATKKPLIGVTLQEKGSNHSVQTGADGRFSLAINSSPAIVEISLVGYTSRSVTISQPGKELEIFLQPGGQELEEIVVTGYGIKKEAEPLGAVTGVNQSLQGKAAGVQVRLRGSRALPGNSPVIYGSADQGFNTEEYSAVHENNFLSVTGNPVSTFSIDVDAASYSNVRRFLQQGQLPPPGAVRTEELINYFDYDYAQPTDNRPFAIHTEIVECPWNRHHHLVSIGLQGRKIPVDNLPPSNLVFLIDVSGSMMSWNKLPLVKTSLKLLTDQLREQDKVALVVYAGNAGVVLPATSGANKTGIKEAIDALEAGGSTAGGEGIRLAYKIAKENFSKAGNNRVILCTDGDFNVGASSDADMEKLIEKERESGIFLTVLGYGMGNYKDSKMQLLADKGNGNHAYIDGIAEAKKVLVHEFGGTLFTIAKDVKLQIEFNPVNVSAYRLIGYENRLLQKEDFNNDKKDAGDLGSGHTVTALYEIIPTGVKDVFIDSVDVLKYQKLPAVPVAANGEIMQVKFRYKQPDGNESRLIVRTIEKKDLLMLPQASQNFLFAAAVAEWGMLLNNSLFKQESSFEHIIKMAGKSIGVDEHGYRKEFIKLVKKSAVLYVTSEPEESDLSDN